jgi:hypothetical protein
MRNLISLGVKAESINAAVGCIVGLLGTTVEGSFTRIARQAVVEGGVALQMQIAEEMKGSDGKCTS